MSWSIAPMLLPSTVLTVVPTSLLVSMALASGDHAWRWAREFLFYDPVPTLERVNVPFLAVFGTLDRNTPVEDSAAVHERCFSGRPSADLTVRFFAGANHGLQVARTGGPNESKDGLPYVAGYFETMADWILART